MVYLGIVCNLQSYLYIIKPLPCLLQVKSSYLYSLFLYSFPKKKTKMKKKRHRGVFPFINSHSNIFLITSHTDTLSYRMGPKGDA